MAEEEVRLEKEGKSQATESHANPKKRLAKNKTSQISQRLSIGIVITKGIIILIILNLLMQKTSYGFDNFYINNYKYKS